MGELSVLNVFRGDMKFSFDSANPQEVERAKRVVEDMLKRGYSLFVDEGDGKLKKVKKFDAATCEYIIADGALYQGNQNGGSSEQETTARTETPRGKGKQAPTRRVPACRVKTTGIAPTAGG